VELDLTDASTPMLDAASDPRTIDNNTASRSLRSLKMSDKRL
jgi:hypothetical protein